MRTVMDPFEDGVVMTVEPSGGKDVTPASITTTLYDLIAAMQAFVDLDEESLVVAAVASMLRTGRLTWRSSAIALESL